MAISVSLTSKAWKQRVASLKFTNCASVDLGELPPAACRRLWPAVVPGASLALLRLCPQEDEPSNDMQVPRIESPPTEHWEGFLGLLDRLGPQLTSLGPFPNLLPAQWDQFVQYLPKLTRLTELRVFDLSTQVDLLIAALPPRVTQLEVFKYRWRSDESGKIDPRHWSTHRLRTLTLQGVNFDNSSSQAPNLSELCVGYLTGLRSFQLAHVSIDDTPAALNQLTDLHTLRLRSLYSGGFVFHDVLQSAASLTGLTRLQIAATCVQDYPIGLETLGQLTNLRHLDLRGFGMTSNSPPSDDDTNEWQSFFKSMTQLETFRVLASEVNRVLHEIAVVECPNCASTIEEETWIRDPDAGTEWKLP